MGPGKLGRYIFFYVVLFTRHRVFVLVVRVSDRARRQSRHSNRSHGFGCLRH